MRRGQMSAFVILTLMAVVSGGALAQDTGAVAGHMTASGEYDQEHLGAAGLQKCAAFKRVQRHSDALQSADHGQLTPGDTRRLAAELAHARRLPPRQVAAPDCGVPL